MTLLFFVTLLYHSCRDFYHSEFWSPQKVAVSFCMTSSHSVPLGFLQHFLKKKKKKKKSDFNYETKKWTTCSTIIYISDQIFCQRKLSGNKALVWTHLQNTARITQRWNVLHRDEMYSWVTEVFDILWFFYISN